MRWRFRNAAIGGEMNAKRVVALLGRRDEPTDGVADYCDWLGQAMGAQGFALETYRVVWSERGWGPALRDLRVEASGWAGCWVLLQFTNLAWSRRGFPLHAPRILAVLRESGARCGVVLHDFEPFPGTRVIDRVRRSCQLRVLRRLYDLADLTIFTALLEKVSWLPTERSKAVFIPIGANCPAAPTAIGLPPSDSKTVAVFCMTGGTHTDAEVRDIGYALKRVKAAAGRLRLVVLGRGSREAEPALRAEFAGTGVSVETLGLLSPEEVSHTLARSDVLLFVRGTISSRRGSAIAGIACGLPIVCYAGPETGWPITEAGVLAVPQGDREALSRALESVLTDEPFRATLAERSRHAQEQYFSWPAIASGYAAALKGQFGAEQNGCKIEIAANAQAH
jgi:glycosyltransferase involved in cell wall biosynthesis